MAETDIYIMDMLSALNGGIASARDSIFTGPYTRAGTTQTVLPHRSVLSKRSNAFGSIGKKSMVGPASIAKVASPLQSTGVLMGSANSSPLQPFSIRNFSFPMIDVLG